jgi:hypothetical protein
VLVIGDMTNGYHCLIIKKEKKSKRDKKNKRKNVKKRKRVPLPAAVLHATQKHLSYSPALENIPPTQSSCYPPPRHQARRALHVRNNDALKKTSGMKIATRKKEGSKATRDHELK